MRILISLILLKLNNNNKKEMEVHIVKTGFTPSFRKSIGVFVANMRALRNTVKKIAAPKTVERISLVEIFVFIT